MPIYEYRCKSCGKVFEELVPREPEKPLPCPECKSKKTEKLMSVFSGMVGNGPSGHSSAGQSCSSGMCPMA